MIVAKNIRASMGLEQEVQKVKNRLKLKIRYCNYADNYQLYIVGYHCCSLIYINGEVWSVYLL